MDGGHNELIIPFPPIPVELVRCILEVAAEDTETCLALARVSKPVQEWINPILYHTVILRDLDETRLFYRTLLVSSSSPGTNVRRLYVELEMSDPYDDSDEEIISSVLLRCKQLESFITDVDMEVASELIATTQSHVWQLVLIDDYTAVELPLSLDHPFRNLSHLYVSYTRLGEDMFDLLELLPRLTHLSFGCKWFQEPPWFADSVRRCLEALPALSVLLLHAFSLDGPVEEMVGLMWLELAKIKDERLFAGPGLYREGHIKNLRAGRTIWDDVAVRFEDWRNLVCDVPSQTH